MPTLNQITSDIRNIASSGKENYSMRIEDSQIEFWVNEARSKFIADAINKRENLTDIWIQVIHCLELELVDKSTCCFITTNCYILKSKKKLPQTIEYYNDNGIIKVTTADGKIISKSNNFEATYNEFNRYTGKKANWFIQDGYLYITNEVLIDYVTVFGIFEDPSELSGFINCSGNTCFSIDDPYPCSLKMANDITNYVIRAKVLPFYSTIPDKSNDANSEDGLKNPNGLTQR